MPSLLSVCTQRRFYPPPSLCPTSSLSSSCRSPCTGGFPPGTQTRDARLCRASCRCSRRIPARATDGASSSTTAAYPSPRVPLTGCRAPIWHCLRRVWRALDDYTLIHARRSSVSPHSLKTFRACMTCPRTAQTPPSSIGGVGLGLRAAWASSSSHPSSAPTSAAGRAPSTLRRASSSKVHAEGCERRRRRRSSFASPSPAKLSQGRRTRRE